MHIAIYEPDDIAAHILTFVARRRGHKAVVLATRAELHEALPFEPAAIIAAVERVDERALGEIGPLRSRYPEAVTVVTPEAVGSGDSLFALKSGLTDVVAKPYHPHEVMLRAELALANRRVSDTSGAIRAGDLHVDFDRFSAVKAGAELVLTKLELRLLYCLLEHYPQVAPTDRLLSFGWETMEPPEANLLKTHISHLRKKLQDAGGERFEIRSRHSLGYTLERVEAGGGAPATQPGAVREPVEV